LFFDGLVDEFYEMFDFFEALVCCVYFDFKQDEHVIQVACTHFVFFILIKDIFIKLKVYEAIYR